MKRLAENESHCLGNGSQKKREKRGNGSLLELFATITAELVGGRILRFTLWALDVLWLQRRTTATAELLCRWILRPTLRTLNFCHRS